MRDDIVAMVREDGAGRRDVVAAWELRPRDLEFTGIDPTGISCETYGSAQPVARRGLSTLERSLKGKSVCAADVRLAQAGLMVPLVHDDRLVMHHMRVSDGSTEVIVLVDRSASDAVCTGGRIDAALEIPPHPRKQIVTMDCSVVDTRDVTGQAVGLLDESRTPGRFAPRVAWRVNLQDHRFDPVDPGRVRCVQEGLD